MRAEIIATGSELLTGGVPDTNSLFLSERLLDAGIGTAFKTVVGDSEKDMEDALRRAIGRADVVLVTGGIGPTDDDITRKVVAKITKRRLVLQDDALASIKNVFASRKREYIGTNDRQALVPAGARIIANPVGIAPGFLLEEGETLLAVLPGVPGEMKAMFDGGLRQVLEERCGKQAFLKRKVFRTCGMSESAVNLAIQDVMRREGLQVGLTAHAGGVDIRITARDADGPHSQALIERAEADIRRQLGDAVYGADSQELEDIVGALMKQRGRRLAVAESCTGGLLAGRITSAAGSSEYFERGVVVYSNRSKTELLGVPGDLLERHGAVSREAAAAMAKGIRRTAQSDLGLAVTGIAGPGGGSDEKPVGLVYIALASAGGEQVDEHRFLGSRDQVRAKAVQAALDMVRRHLIG